MISKIEKIEKSDTIKIDLTFSCDKTNLTEIIENMGNKWTWETDLKEILEEER